MGKNTTHLLIGLAAGMVIGVLGYRFSQSEKVAELHDNATRAWLKTRIKARKAYRKAKHSTADSIVHGAHALADKADEIKASANNYRQRNSPKAGF